MASLRTGLGKVYRPPTAIGGHDIQHIERLLLMYREISELIPGVSEFEYEIAVWLHNLDRYPALLASSGALNLTCLIHLYLAPGKLEPETTERIITAVMEHSKKDDGTNDSPLLQALRLADKWDRIGILGITDSFSWKGPQLPAYEKTGFGYGSTAEGSMTCHYQNFYRVLEWYTMYPLIRELVRRKPHRFEHLLACIRMFAREVSEAQDVPNTVEDDIARCLGNFYPQWHPK